MSKNIPYGYRIENGMAVPVSEEVENLTTYFTRYIAGFSMAEAIACAGIECCPGSYRYILHNRIYLGTDYYPQILPQELMDRAAAEYEKRHVGRTDTVPGVRIRPVPVRTKFAMRRMGSLQTQDPQEFAARLYARIRPRI